MCDGNFIKLNRKILEWEWWHDINTYRLFTFLLLKANWKDNQWKGITIKRGSYVSSLSKVASDIDLTVDELRTAIKHLKSTKEITTVATAKYTVFSVVNYDLYQNIPTVNPNQIPNYSQAITNKRRIEEYKNNTVGVDIYISAAQELAYELLPRYWNREPTENDIELVKNKITRIKNHEIIVDETKVEFLKYAFEQSGFANKMSWQYVSGVFKRLANRGIDTIDKLMDFEIKESN